MHRKKRSNIVIRILFGHHTIALVFLAILVFIGLPVYKNINKKYKIDQEITELEKEIMELEAGNTNLKKIINYLESDQFVEEQARLSFGMKKPGEEVVVIGNEGQVAGVSDVVKEKVEIVEDIINPIRWWRYFFEPQKNKK